jgi:Uma2 family endonuclease
MMLRIALSFRIPDPTVTDFHKRGGDASTMATAHVHKPKSRTKKDTAPKTKAPVSTPLSDVTTIADLLERLGNIPAHRVRLHPTPGTATEQDLLLLVERERRLCELVEGTLVEKPVGYDESRIAGLIITYMNLFVLERNLGSVTGPDGTIRLQPGLVRLPDVAFASWNCFPSGKLPQVPIPEIAPDLAVEVLSKSNTKPEITRKLGEYFQAGVRLVWVVDPKKRTVRVYTAPKTSILKKYGESLDGGDVLPGFSLPLAKIFVRNKA